MKLLKYVLFIVVLILSIVFIIQLNELNLVDGQPIKIKFPYIIGFSGYEDGIKVWEAIILTLSIGVFLGFIIALYQIIAQKTEMISLKSKIRRLKNELDGLRNQSLEDEIDLEDSIESDDNL
tara:strand:- start:702 stop:1067 length:366 start_codon:yes stop_codon:yes gene_type:complete